MPVDVIEEPPDSAANRSLMSPHPPSGRAPSGGAQSERRVARGGIGAKALTRSLYLTRSRTSNAAARHLLKRNPVFKSTKHILMCLQMPGESCRVPPTLSRGPCGFRHYIFIFSVEPALASGEGGVSLTTLR